jgi:hypothetical protein
MKIKIYLVTYKGHKRLPPTLKSLFESDVTKHDFQIYIINNHTDIQVPNIYLYRAELQVLNNVLRPDWSSGHLSRNWNQALINGFKSLTNPDCDVVVCSQDDSIFHPQWASRLETILDHYDFVHGGHGDQFHAYKPEAVRKVGLWDERFCGISRQAADYFFRCALWNREGSTIQDIVHKRVLNPIHGLNLELSQNFLVDADVRNIDQVWDNTLHGNDHLSYQFMLHKWGFDPFPWSDALLNGNHRPKCKNYITYPYFEKDIYDLQGKGYLV